MFIDDVQALPGDPTVFFLQRSDRRVDWVGDARAGRKLHRLQKPPRVLFERLHVTPDARMDVCSYNAIAPPIPSSFHGLLPLLLSPLHFFFSSFFFFFNF